MSIGKRKPADNGHESTDSNDYRIFGTSDEDSPIVAYEDSNLYHVFTVPTGDGSEATFRAQQLVALEEYSVDEVFADDTIAHHESHPYLNLPSAVTVMDRGDHLKLHRGRGLWSDCEDGIPRFSYRASIDDLIILPPRSDVDSEGDGK
jgi:hypothetical protein